MTAQSGKELRLPEISSKDNLVVAVNDILYRQEIIIGIVVEDMKQHDGRLHTVVNQPLTHRLGMGDDEISRVEDANVLTRVAVIAQRLDIVDNEDDAVVENLLRLELELTAKQKKLWILLISI